MPSSIPFIFLLALPAMGMMHPHECRPCPSGPIVASQSRLPAESAPTTRAPALSLSSGYHDGIPTDQVGPCPSDGHYALYANNGGGEPLAIIAVKKGQPIGFEKTDAGRLIAVAADRRIPLPPDKKNPIWVKKRGLD